MGSFAAFLSFDLDGIMGLAAIREDTSTFEQKVVIIRKVLTFLTLGFRASCHFLLELSNLKHEIKLKDL